MAIGAEPEPEPLSSQPLQPPSTSGGNDAGDFECNICFELAQEPIVTLCGHLFCWPCLYRWLRLHSQSQDCPVCKAIIDEEKLVPLYGRGKTPATDPRLKSVPGIEIPNRPAGQRPQTASPPESNSLPNFGYGLAGFRNFAMSAGFGGLIPPLLNIQFHGFPYALYGAQSGFNPNSFSGPFQTYPNAGIIPGRQQQQQQQADYYLKMLFFMIGLFVVIALI
ncbi:E3 ubiquitin-protein ligase RNF185-like [Impatiens glandulifera]|uniref:E3 ubiquitin-protein ligase RNF185-like n=1 Tax=Impatiens glandulifera TaxID=253017 RepID=UPI001FB11A44|nr:E3 ubiquitin-protein ligase RNF185-like [Impatiens glandulifera]